MTSKQLAEFIEKLKNVFLTGVAFSSIEEKWY